MPNRAVQEQRMKNTTSNLLFQTVVDVGGLRDGAGEGSLHSAIEGKLVDTTHTHRKKKRRKSRRRVHIKLRPAEPNARVTKMSFSYAREGNAKHHGRCFFSVCKKRHGHGSKRNNRQCGAVERGIQEGVGLLGEANFLFDHLIPRGHIVGRRWRHTGKCPPGLCEALFVFCCCCCCCRW